ncbi:MAG: hypothetical protein WB562_07610 [Candidatus Sulfotelmatobacter sp.]
MKPSLPASRTPSALSAPVHQRLSTYAIAAGAAGVALLALPRSSEAEIVYTPADQTIGRQGTYNLDLNHDGIIDYVLAEHAIRDGSFGTIQALSMKAPTGNHVQCVTSDCISTFIYAAALRPGSQIRSAHQRGWCAPGGAEMAFAELDRRGSVYYADGWVNVNNRYLGLRFQINGENHYGWARLSVKFHAGLPKNRTWIAYLTGYAYETVPDRTILAGQMNDDTTAAAAQLPTSPDAAMPGSLVSRQTSEPARIAHLGALALGSAAIAVWRREEPEVFGKPATQSSSS